MKNLILMPKKFVLTENIFLLILNLLKNYSNFAEKLFFCHILFIQNY